MRDNARKLFEAEDEDAFDAIDMETYAKEKPEMLQ
jgi:hypothetical protein